jgi:hypothetical protein
MRADFSCPTQVPLVASRRIRKKVLVARDAGHLLVEHHRVRPLEVAVAGAILPNEYGQIMTSGTNFVTPVGNRHRGPWWFQ